MKTNRLYIGIAVILLFTVWQVKGQEYYEFAPVGAEWYYTNTLADPLESCSKYSVEKDTLIEGSLCKMVICSFSYNDYDKIDTVIFKQDGGKIYYYFNEQFNLIYAYDVAVLEEVVFTFKKYNLDKNTVSLVPVKCTVRDIQPIEINGRQYKQFFTTIDTIVEDAWFYVSHNHIYKYIEQIGHPYVFMEELKTGVDMAVYTRVLRCYIEDDFHYINPWWQQYDLPCDTLVHYKVPDNIISMEMKMASVAVYPNPANDKIHVELNEENFLNGTVRIIDPVGQIVYSSVLTSIKKTVSIAHLSAGIYVLQYSLKNQTFQSKFLKTN
ncbi:MAG: T9SS type A sorting domain-containing protein [Bacteroidales bacterium]|nr:T9SS type A sorting domain-containing protein [Bacteroidales bacterium]